MKADGVGTSASTPAAVAPRTSCTPAGRAPHFHGSCSLCGDAPLAHGPWTEAEIAETCADLGIEVEDFADWCDGCFIVHVAGGDVAYAQGLIGDRPLMLGAPE